MNESFFFNETGGKGVNDVGIIFVILNVWLICGFECGDFPRCKDLSRRDVREIKEED